MSILVTGESSVSFELTPNTDVEKIKQGDLAHYFLCSMERQWLPIGNAILERLLRVWDNYEEIGSQEKLGEIFRLSVRRCDHYSGYQPIVDKLFPYVNSKKNFSYATLFHEFQKLRDRGFGVFELSAIELKRAFKLQKDPKQSFAEIFLALKGEQRPLFASDCWQLGLKYKNVVILQALIENGWVEIADNFLCHLKVYNGSKERFAYAFLLQAFRELKEKGIKNFTHTSREFRKAFQLQTHPKKVFKEIFLSLSGDEFSMFSHNCLKIGLSFQIHAIVQPLIENGWVEWESDFLYPLTEEACLMTIQWMLLLLLRSQKKENFDLVWKKRILPLDAETRKDLDWVPHFKELWSAPIKQSWHQEILVQIYEEIDGECAGDLFIFLMENQEYVWAERLLKEKHLARHAILDGVQDCVDVPLSLQHVIKKLLETA